MSIVNTPPMMVFVMVPAERRSQATVPLFVTMPTFSEPSAQFLRPMAHLAPELTTIGPVKWLREAGTALPNVLVTLSSAFP